MRSALTAVFLCAAVSAAPVPVEAKKTPLDKIQGKWVIVSLDRGEGPISPTGDFASYTLTIDGQLLSTGTASAPAYQKLKVVCDGKADPIQLDVQFGGDKWIRGIIKIEKDQLHWCHAQAGEPRPQSFEGREGHQYYIWKRESK